MWVALRRLLQLLLQGAGPVPQHIAFIMDGNRRFADQEHMDRLGGHTAGYKKMVEVLRWCLELGVRCVSVYAFSIDNFGRQAQEVADLMHLAEAKYLELCKDPSLASYKVAVRVVGDLALAPPQVQAAAARLMATSAKQAGPRPSAVVNICFAYTSTQELEASLSALRSGLESASLLPADVSPWLLRRCMHTGDSPPVDLLIRTSGAQRLSDYLLWQAAAAQLQFTEVLWPAFGFADLAECILGWQRAQPALQQLQDAANAHSGLACPLVRGASASSAASFGLVEAVTAEHEASDGGAWSSGVHEAAAASACGQLQAAAACSAPGCACASSAEDGPEVWAAVRGASPPLSSISEDVEVHVPHPSSRTRVAGFLRRREADAAAWVARTAAAAPPLLMSKATASAG